jgi:uncharacterized protein YggT (Ycf19 family)
MSFGPWNALFDAFLLVLWLRVWTGDERAALFNPYLAALRRIGDRVTEFLRPVFFGLSPRLVALVVILFLVAFRGLALNAEAPGVLRIGFEMRRPDTSRVLFCVASSALSFTLFLYQIWGLSLVYFGFSRSATAWSGHPVETLYYLGRPFTDLPRTVRPPALLLFGTALALLLGVLGRPVMTHTLPPFLPLDPATSTQALVGAAVVALSGWVNILATIRSAMILLIIGSLVSLFASAPGIAVFCRDWTDFLLGPARRWRLHVAMLDLTPLVFLFVVGFIHGLLQGVLLQSFMGLVS